MATVEKGDLIRVHYKGRFKNGTVFDSSEPDSPIQFKVGEGDLIKGFEQGVIGMSVGEEKEVMVSAEEGYGVYMKEKVFAFDRSRAPENFDPEIGQQIQMYRADGMPINVTVVDKSEKSFILDCNHPLAGKDLIFNIKLIEIIDKI